MENKEASLRAFLAFLREPRQKRELLICAAAMLLLGIALHILYPFPFFFPDTGSYVLSAKEGVFNAYRPMGYSDYLSLLHGISSSLGFVFVATYLLHALSTLWLLFSAKFLFGIRDGRLFGALCALAIVAPRLLFASNFLMSDSLFNTLTTLFVTSALWICFSRNIAMILFHLFVFALLYKVRYVGMFYVPVTLLALGFMPLGRRWTKLGLMALPVLLFAVLYGSAKKEYIRQTGVDTFSAFSGWQLLNNASVLIPEAKAGLKTQDFAPGLVRNVHAFMQSCPDTLFNRRNMLSTACMWDKDLPYKYFMFQYMQATGQPYVPAWVQTGVVYGEYAARLIREYPGRYFSRFVLPSAGSMFAPQDIVEEKIAFVNEPMYRDYYGVTAERYEHAPRLFASLNPLRRVLNAVYWGMLVVSLVAFAVRWRKLAGEGERKRKGALLLASFMLIYLGSSVLASPCTTWRYSMPIYLSSLVFAAFVAQTFIGERKMAGK